MKMKRLLSITLAALLLVTLLAGCGSGSYKGNSYDSGYAASTSAAYAPVFDSDAGYEEAGWYDEPMAVSNGDYSYAEEAKGDAEWSGMVKVEGTANEKIIYSAWLNLETTEFDSTIAKLEELVKNSGGYILSSSINGNTRYNYDGSTSVVDRYASYSIAVPTANYESVLNYAGALGNVTGRNQSAENVTSQYSDIEARIESLKVQQERILDMMKKAEKVEDLIALESRLSDINYELDSYQRSLKNYDRRIAFSTIDFSINEVYHYTPTAPVTRTFWQKLGDSFSDGWSSFGYALQEIALWFAESIPVILILVVLVVVIVVLIKRWHRKAAIKVTLNTRRPVEPAETTAEASNEE